MKIVIEGSFRYPEPRGKPTDMIVGKLSVTSAHRNATTSHAQKKSASGVGIFGVKTLNGPRTKVHM